jgi:hypothetical protein
MNTGEININDGNWLCMAVDEFDLGLDVGSVSVNLVVMTPAGEVLKEEYRRHLGQPQSIALELLSSLEPAFPLQNCRLAAFTGLGGQTLAEVLGGSWSMKSSPRPGGPTAFVPRPAPSSTWAARTPS